MKLSHYICFVLCLHTYSTLQLELIIKLMQSKLSWTFDSSGFRYLLSFILSKTGEDLISTKGKQQLRRNWYALLTIEEKCFHLALLAFLLSLNICKHGKLSLTWRYDTVIKNDKYCNHQNGTINLSYQRKYLNHVTIKIVFCACNNVQASEWWIQRPTRWKE